MTGRIVRPATPADVPEMLRVINAAYRVEDFFIEGDRTSSDDLKDRFAREGAGFLVIEVEPAGTLAGALYVEVRGKRGYFGMLSVDPARQGEGLGRVLIEAVEEHCRTAGCADLDIDVVNLREELPAFYQQFGFRAAGTAPFHSTEKLRREAHLVFMTKSLQKAD
jgi:GNAT superfamily N-acetyltransferase